VIEIGYLVVGFSALLLIGVDELTRREFGPREVHQIGARLFGSFRKSVMTYIIVLTAWVAVYWNSLHFTTQFSLYDELTMFLYITLAYPLLIVWQYDRWFPSTPKIVGHSGNHIVSMVEHFVDSDKDVRGYLVGMVDRFDDKPTKHGFEEYEAAKDQLLSREDEIGEVFRQILFEKKRQD
jgi:hypothetical protein